MNKILIINFGSQYTHLISNSIRKLNIYSEIVPWTHFDSISFKNVYGIILSGSPKSVLEIDFPNIYINKIPLDIPILGICYGAQLIAKKNLGKIITKREYGSTEINIIHDDPIFFNIPKTFITTMSHSDSIEPPHLKFSKKMVQMCI